MNIEKHSRTTPFDPFPLEVREPRKWVSILTLPPSYPKISSDVTWGDLLPEGTKGLAKVIEEITNSIHPFEHQEQAITSLVTKGKDMIINGGTFSGKSLSFTVPGIVKLLQGDLDFFVVFYPSKQLLLDQFERMKELVVKLQEATSIRLTVKMYSGDISKGKHGEGSLFPRKELYETEQDPPTILLATFDKVWYQLISGKKHPLLEKLQKCQYMVFDEIHAFEGFAAAIIKGFIQIHKQVNPTCQVVLSSATIDAVNDFRDDFLTEAKIITCPPVRGEQEFLASTKEQAVPLLVELWQGIAEFTGKFCLVFLDSKEEIELLAERLCLKLQQENPFFDNETVAILHADMPYAQRKRILDEVRKEQNNRIRILLSSSVLELGVNLPNVQTVVNIGIPVTQKDGIVQRMARNRSQPEERRVNIFLFNLAHPRDNFYWEHIDILRTILETNACNPILYPRRNPKILAGLFILHLRYGISDFGEIMTHFLREGVATHEIVRQQYTKLVCSKVLKKEHGKVLFTGEGETILLQQMRKNNVLIPFSIRAISSDWTIHLQTSNFSSERNLLLGKISVGDVLKKGLPGNLLTRNKKKYVVTDVDHQQRIVYVKNVISDTSRDKAVSQPYNLLFDPTITVGVFPKKYPHANKLTISFGELTITRKVRAIATTEIEEKIANQLESTTKPVCFRELSSEESDELTILEQVEGMNISLGIDLGKSVCVSNKDLLKLFGEILLLETEMVLSIPATEFGLAYNTNQLAIYDKGEPNGNTDYLYQHLAKVAHKALKRLQGCSCERGCKKCYGEILGLLPEGTKNILANLLNELVNNEMSIRKEDYLPLAIQDNYQEGKIIALSDIHLGSEYCYQEEFFEAISTLSTKADILIINGDLLDSPSEKGKELFERLQQTALQEGFWTKLAFVRSSTIHDAFIEQSSSALYLDYVLLETAVGEILFVHGNKIGIDPNIVKSMNAEQAAIQAKNQLTQNGRLWLPKITPETHLVIGHLHERFYNERWRVYGLGHWTKKNIHYNQKCIMYIDLNKNTDSIKLMRINNQLL